MWAGRGQSRPRGAAGVLGWGTRNGGGVGQQSPQATFSPGFQGSDGLAALIGHFRGGGGVDRHIGGNPFKIKAVTLVGSLAGLERHQCH